MRVWVALNIALEQAMKNAHHDEPSYGDDG